MAELLNEEQLIESNLFHYEQRLDSPYNRYQSKSATYTTYYHINNEESVLDGAYKDSESILGPRSPLRFNKINNFPLYGIEQIVIDLEDDEQGLDGSYTGRCDILPNTIKPLENDFFIINHLKRHDVYLFRVTSVTYDNVKTDNFYSIEFILDAIDETYIENLENQVITNYRCLSDNIGTEEKCIIEEEIYDRISKVKEMYKDMKDTYLSIFYNETYNCLLGEMPCNQKLYDPFMSRFCNEHDLFNDRNTLNTYIFSEEVIDPRFKLKYQQSVYRFIERREERLLQNFYYEMYIAMKVQYSSFYKWHDSSVYILDINSDKISSDNSPFIFSDSFVESFNDEIIKVTNASELIRKYILDDNISIKDIPLDLHESLLSLNANLEFFFIIPILMYIIRYILQKEQRNDIRK